MNIEIGQEVMRSLCVVGCLFVTGCSSNAEVYRAADGKIVCDLMTNTAFIVQHGAGDTSVVERSKYYDTLCAQRNLK